MIEQLLQLLLDADRPLSSAEIAENLFKTAAPPSPLAEKLVAAIAGGSDRISRNRAGEWILCDRHAPAAPDGWSVMLCKAFPESSSCWQEWQGFALLRLRSDGREKVGLLTGADLVQGLAPLLQKTAKLLAPDEPLLFDGFGNQVSLFRTVYRGLLGAELLQPLINLRRVVQADSGKKIRTAVELSQQLHVPAYECDSFSLQIDLLAEQVEAALASEGAAAVVLPRWIELCRQPVDDIDFSRYAFTREDLRSLPPLPGVYRMYDRAGQLLYVGKARSLADRLRSYFISTEELDAKVSTLRDHLHRIEIERVGSELEALLLEQEWIEKADPPINRQLKVHQRPQKSRQRYPQIILLPSTDEGAVQLYFLHPQLGLDDFLWPVSGERTVELQNAVKNHFFSQPLAGEAPNKRWRSEIAASWLARRFEQVNRIDMRLVTSAKEAVRLVASQAKNVLDHPEEVVIQW
ncbi:MAG TPA: nucleotide excision repair endonuclease [bacterium]|nr:nucleotide excision repair endonuclease [bacterium]HNT65686.1 nucleotide excision repair endonuclease [bacterium]HOX84845.1 nucleotide excision repair endonuclease [bacterium]HPG44289.1 nucleotide excision repair endonuclease [bacterium]HPM96656.1 nucleotide excision repair endonuclease [bacterium]